MEQPKTIVLSQRLVQDIVNYIEKSESSTLLKRILAEYTAGVKKEVEPTSDKVKENASA